MNNRAGADVDGRHMNKREAKALVCRGAAELLDNGSENAWLSEGFSDEDAERVAEAFAELVAELRRRGANAPSTVIGGIRT